MPNTAGSPGRVDWVDHAKGLCIFFVVMLHATRYVEYAAGREGWLHHVVDFARPFRMPDFFLNSGLFLSQVIDREWRSYLDKKVIHFGYFYALWLAIELVVESQLGLEAGPVALAQELGWNLVQPEGSLWFIYVLPIFFVLTKLLRRAPWPLVWLGAALLQVLEVNTGSIVVDRTAERFVYFYTGYLFAPQVFAAAAWAASHARRAGLLLVAWALLNGTCVWLGAAAAPGASLALGLLGALAVTTVAALLSRTRLADPVRYAGQHSLVIYLACFAPMKLMKRLLFDSGLVLVLDLGTVALLATTAGVLGPLLLHRLVKDGRARWLFVRPAWARLDARSAVEVGIANSAVSPALGSSGASTALVPLELRVG
jgi:uncharacterized membrane protein YcfT